ncbi:MAG: hypothetical protein AB1295_04715 [Candidatus Micrarchaeota archaeon]
MTFKKPSGERKACPWESHRKRKIRGDILGEDIQKKQLHIARKALKLALESGEMKHAIAAAEHLLQLPARYRNEALDGINRLLADCKSGEADEIEAIRALSFVLMNLNKSGWAMLESWEKTQPLLDKHSGLLADSLFMGNMNGTDNLSLEALGFLANCGSYSYDAPTLRYMLQRFIGKPESAPGYYTLTGALSREGPDGHRQVAQEMEDERIERAIAKLEYGDDRQFEGSRELIFLVASGRGYLVPQLGKVRQEMLSLMEDPGIYPDGDEDEEGIQAVKGRQDEVFSKAASILGELGSIGLPALLRLEGNDSKEMRKALALFRKLAAHGVDLHVVVPAAAADKAKKMLASVPEGQLHMESEGDEAAMLIQSVLSPHDGDAEERAKAVSRLKALQEKGLALEFAVDCSEEHDAGEQAADLSRILSLLEEEGLAAKVSLTGPNAEAVRMLVGADPALVGDECPSGQAQNASGMMGPERLLQMAMFPAGEDAEEAELVRLQAIAALKPIQDAGAVLSLTIDCPADIPPKDIAKHLNLALDILEMNGLFPEVRLSGDNARAVAYLMNLGA